MRTSQDAELKAAATRLIAQALQEGTDLTRGFKFEIPATDASGAKSFFKIVITHEV
jgi:hypothetical protein